MKEQVLLDYLTYKISVCELAADLIGSQKSTGRDVTSVYIESLDSSSEFQISRDHIIRLCKESLSGNLPFESINTIAFAIITSDFFILGDEDEIMKEVVYDWDNPDIGYPLTKSNMEK